MVKKLFYGKSLIKQKLKRSLIKKSPTRLNFMMLQILRMVILDTNEIYPSISAVGKNYRNLATALRKGNGKCIYRKQHWKLVDDN